MRDVRGRVEGGGVGERVGDALLVKRCGRDETRDERRKRESGVRRKKRARRRTAARGRRARATGTTPPPLVPADERDSPFRICSMSSREHSPKCSAQNWPCSMSMSGSPARALAVDGAAPRGRAGGTNATVAAGSRDRRRGTTARMVRSTRFGFWLLVLFMVSLFRSFLLFDFDFDFDVCVHKKFRFDMYWRNIQTVPTYITYRYNRQRKILARSRSHCFSCVSARHLLLTACSAPAGRDTYRGLQTTFCFQKPVHKTMHMLAPQFFWRG